MIHKNIKVKIPSKTVRYSNNGIYYELSRTYNSNNKYNTPKRICIGKAIDDKYMNPNENYETYFPSESLLKEPSPVTVYVDDTKLTYRTQHEVTTGFVLEGLLFK